MLMKRELEDHLWEHITVAGEDRGQAPRYVIAEMLEAGMIQSPKQAYCTLEKWERQGCYDYGVSLDLGWKTDHLPGGKPRR